VDSHGSEVYSGVVSFEKAANQLPSSEVMNTKAEKSTLLGAITYQQLVKTN
jgi:hypothetical protein